MPSPFPGMDPYLEARTEWPGLHDLLIASTVGVLQPQLMARGYYANPGERVWITEPGRPIYPDVAVIREPPNPPPATASTTVADPPVRVVRPQVQIREPYIDIHHTESGRLVAGIEFLSPWNKATREGRRLYRRKQRACERDGIHLVEIDLLRSGRHVAAVPQEIVEPYRPYQYLIHIHRADTDAYEFYPLRIRDRLPRIPIPLHAGDADAVLDLQSAFDQAYDTGPYRVRIDYSKPPTPPLADEDSTWAEQLLKDKGLR